MNLELINQELKRFSQERDWEQFHSIKNLAMALSVEVAELVEIFQWMKEEESNKIAENPVVKARVEEEVADVFLYLVRIVSKLNINLEEVAHQKIKLNGEKYPVERARGTAKKYHEL